MKRRSTITPLLLAATLLAVALAGCPVTPSIPSDEPEEVTPGQMISIPAGTFQMGERWNEWSESEYYERPVHNVTLSAYEIGKYEVTNREYADILNWAVDTGRLADTSGDISAYGTEILGTTWSYCQISYLDGQFVVESRDGYSMADHPVVQVSWYGAAVYCNWLSESEGLQPCYNTATWACDFSKGGYYLPTEAQWERAAAWEANGLGRHHYRYGNGSDSISPSNVNGDNPLGLSSRPYTSPVGHYSDALSPAGCYDMSGNVREWCNDWWGRVYTSHSVTDPEGPASGWARVCRGGSWGSQAVNCRSAYRDYVGPQTWSGSSGFRVARTP